MMFALIEMAVGLAMIVGIWKVFEKAGKPGWAAIIPIYNLYVLLQVAGKPGWWLVLCFIPLVNLIIWIITLVAPAAKFGKGAGFVIGLIFLPFIFYPILGFGDAEYFRPRHNEN